MKPIELKAAHDAANIERDAARAERDAANRIIESLQQTNLYLQSDRNDWQGRYNRLLVDYRELQGMVTA